MDQKLTELGTKEHFDRLLVKCTWFIGLSFAVSAILNFILSRMIVVTEPSVDKIAFNDEVGQMMGWSLPVISIPCMIVSGYAFWLLIKGIKQFTGLSMEEVMAQAPTAANIRVLITYRLMRHMGMSRPLVNLSWAVNRLPFMAISFQWDNHPGALPRANKTVNISVGKPIA